MASASRVVGRPTIVAPPAVVRAHPQRIRRGDQPTHSPLTGFQQWAWRMFRERVTSRAPDLILEENLLKAHMRIRADEYLALVYATTLFAAIGLGVTGVVLGVVIALSTVWYYGLALALALPVGLTALIYVIMLHQPASRSSARAKNIDRRISASMSFVSAMASADVNIDQIFKELARQKIYGEVAEEAAWITRDTELLGVDILTAIRNGAQRTPSKRFQDFLQGVVTTATSGGQLKPYFLVKAEQYERENKLENLQRVETMGLLAETFVTVVVAFPLFLVIIIAIFAIIGGGGQFMITILWAIVGLMIPLSQFGFIFFMYSLAQEM
ncbi:MAG: type II secretion system F family protein [Thermoplasmata archaeon]